MRKLALVLALGIVLTSVAQADLIAYWPMEEAQVWDPIFMWDWDRTLDASGNALDLDVVGPTLTTSGYQGNALVYNGTGDYLSGTHAELDITTALTVSAWVQRASGGSGGYDCIVGKGDFQYMIRTNDGGRVEFFTHDGSWHQVNGATIPIDEWHHVAGVCDGSTVQVYVDGVPGGSASGGITSDAAVFNVGRNSTHTGRLFEGAIDEVAIWNEALDLTAIQFLAAGGSPLAALPAELTWDDTVNNWGSAHWSGGPPAFPTVAEKGIINAGQVTVAANRGALALEHNGGDIIVGAGNTLTVVAGLTSAPGSTLSLGADSQLVVGSGNIATLQTNGNATVNNSGNVAVSGATFDGGGATGTFTKTGAGTLTLDNTGGTGVVGVQNMTFDVQEGTLHGIGTQPLGGTGPSTGVPAGITLSGGKLTLEGAATTVYNQLNYAFYDNAAASNLPGIDDGVDNDANGGLFTLTPSPESSWPSQVQGKAVWTGEVWQAGNMSDTYCQMWSGQVNVPTGMGGTYQVYVHGDDYEVFWLDIGQDGDFNTGVDDISRNVEGEEGWNTPHTETVTLAGGQTYDLAIAHREGGGGDFFNVEITPPAFTGIPAFRINPSDPTQAGLWSAPGPGAINMTGTPITVAANSELEVLATSAALGTLALNSGVTLTTSGDTMTFLSTTFGTGSTVMADAASTGLGPATVAGSATIGGSGAVTIDTLPLDNGEQMNFTGSGPTVIGSLNNTGGTITLNVTGTGVASASDYSEPGGSNTVLKQGGGTFALDTLTPGSAANTTFQVNAGTLHGIGANPLEGSPEAILNGGKLIVEGAPAVVFDILGEWYFAGSGSGDQGDAQLDPIDSGSGFLTMTPDATNTLDVALQFDDAAALSIRSGGVTGNDNIGAVWFGQINVGGPNLPAGDVSFGTRSDDGSVIWVDLNGNHTFDAGELVVDNKGNHGDRNRVGTANLAAGAYDVAIGFYEDGSGETMHARYVAGAEGNYDNMTFINPGAGAQAGLWSAGAPGALNMTGTAVTVIDDSEIEARANPQADLGVLTINAGKTLTTTGAPMTFLSTDFGTGSAVMANAASTGLGPATVAGNATIGGSGKVTIDTLPLDNGEQMNFVGSGSTTIGSLNNTGGTITLNVTGTGVASASDYSEPGGSNTVLKQGGGEFALDGINPASAANTTFQVDAGTLGARGDDPVGNADKVILNGGTLSVTGGPVATIPDAIDHYGYHINNDALALDLDGNGGMMGGGDPALFTSFEGHGLLTDGPGNRGLDFNDDADFRAVPASILDDPSGDGWVIDQNDNYSNLWLGTLHVSGANAGDWGFRNRGDDDRGGIWLDLDQDGVFESSTPGLGDNRGEQISWENGGWKTHNLAAGDYLVAFTHREGGGGSRADFAIRQSVATGGSEWIVKPGAAGQAGLWSAGPADFGGPIDITDTPIDVTADSGISANTFFPPAQFGDLTFYNNSTLTTSGSDMTFTSATITGGAGRRGTLETENNVAISDYADGLTDTFFGKAGGGTLTMDNSGGGILAPATTYEVHAGTLRGIGPNQLGTPPEVVLNGNGAELLVEGTPVTVGAIGHFGYHINNDNLALDLHNNAGMMGGGDPTLGPNYYGQAVLTDGPGGRGLDFNNDADFRNTGAVNQNNDYSNLFVGMIHVTSETAGDWVLRSAQNDDRSGIWIDLDQDGVFESSSSGLGDNRGEQRRWNDNTATTVTLAAGDYMVGLVHREGGGGSGIEYRITAPGMTGEETIKPTAISQFGIWAPLTIGGSTFELDLPGAIDMTGTDITVTAPSTGTPDSFLTAISMVGADFGHVTVHDGAELTTGGATPYIAFTQAILPGGRGTYKPEVPTTLTGTSGLTNPGGVPSTLVAAGKSDLVLNKPPADSMANVTLEGKSGRMVADYVSGDPTGGADIVLTGGTYTAKGAPGTGYAYGRVNYAYYNDAASSNLQNIDDGVDNAGTNNGLFDLTPTPEASWPSQVQGNALWTGEIWLGGMSDTYCQMWSGRFTPPTTGTYEFYVHGDDYEILWIDTDQDHDFEASNNEDISRNIEGEEGWNTPHTETVTLQGGQTYDFALAHREGGGGDFVNVTITKPDGSAERINPSAASQAGWWAGDGPLTEAVDIQNTLTVDNVAQGNALSVSGFMLSGRDALNSTELDFDNNGGLLALTPAGTTMLAGQLAFNGDGEWRALIPEITRNDDYQSLFTGKLTAEGDVGDPAQNYELRFDWSDDRGFMWVDLDRDGVFERAGAGGDERIAWEDHGTKTISLDPGLDYDVAFGHAEHAGGSTFRVWVRTPSMGGQELVDPTAASQAGLWTSATPTSTLELITDLESNLRELILKSGDLRIIGGPGLTIQQASIHSDTSGKVGFIVETPTILTDGMPFNGNGETVEIGKSGAADLILNKPSIGVGNATFIAKGGRLVGVDTGAFGTAALELGGGELALSSTAGPAVFDNATAVTRDSILTACAAGGGVPGQTATLGSAGNGVSLGAGTTLTTRSQDGCTLDVAGPLSGSGGVHVPEGDVDFSGGGIVGSLMVTGGTAGTGTTSVAIAEGGQMTLGDPDAYSNIYTATTGAFSVKGPINNQIADTVIVGGPGTVLTVGNTQGTILNRDIGNPGQAGTFTETGPGAYTIEGGGGDIWGNSDQFHFSYQPGTGDAELIAHVVSVERTNNWAKAGWMIRETLDADSKHAFMAITPRQGASFQRRPSTGGGSEHNSGKPPENDQGYWIRLVRNGDTFTGYKSSDGGVTDPWTQQGTRTFSMSSDVFIGLAVTAHNNGTLSTAVLEDVTGFALGGFPTSLYNLAGEGTVIADNGIVLGGTLGPGDGGPGKLTMQGDLTFEPGATFEVDVQGFVPGDGHDQVAFQGDGNSPTLNDALLDLFTPIGTFQQEDVCNWAVLMDIGDPTAYADGIFSHINPLTSLTEPLPEGASFIDANGAYFWQITYQYEGNDVAIHLVAIPEPGTMALLGLGALALLRRRRRQA